MRGGWFGLVDQCDPCPRRGVSAIPPRASGHPTFHQRPPRALQRSLLAVRRRTVVPRRRRPSCHVPPTGPPIWRTRAPGDIVASNTIPPYDTLRTGYCNISAIANAICDGLLPNRLNHAPSTINMAAVMPLGMIEADLVRQDLNGTRPLAAVEQLDRKSTRLKS